MTTPHTERTFAIVALSGTVATIVTLLLLVKTLPPDMVAWLVVGVLGGAGGLYCGILYLAGLRVREMPGHVVRGATLLAIPSLLILGAHANEVRLTRSFLAIADSSHGRVVAQSGRDPRLLKVRFEAEGAVRHVQGRALVRGLTRGDSVWVYYNASRPDSATIGRPAASVGKSTGLLGLTWFMGGPLLLVFGGTLRWWPVLRGKRAA